MTIVTRYGMEIDLSYEHKTACPRCRVKYSRDSDGDNFHVYGNNSEGQHQGGYCFGCNFTVPSEEWLLENGEERWDFEEEDIMSEEFSPEILQKIKGESSFDPKGYRGIRRDISTSFGCMYQVDTSTGEIDKCFYPTTKDSSGGKPNVVGLKVRIHPKRWNHIGETGKEVELFGSWRVSPSESNTLVICSGEHDALAAAQMLADNTKRYNQRTGNNFNPPAVVSATIGEAGLSRQIQQNYDWVKQFEKVIFIPDSDKAGEKTIEEVFSVIPKGKLFIARLPMKDVNDMLLAGREQDFINAYFKAKPHIPDGVKDAASAFDEIDEELGKVRIPLPPYMHKLQEMMNGGVIQGRICNLIAHTSVGKSLHINNIVYWMMFHSPITPVIVSLEATAAQYVLELMSIHLKTNIRWKMSDEEIRTFLQSDEGMRAKNELCYREDGTPRFFIIDDRAGTIKDLEKQMEELYNKHNCTTFVLDVLSDVLRGSSAEYAEDHMNWQRNMVKNGCTMYNVMHTKKPAKGEDGKDKDATEFDALGTGSFVQSAAYNIIFNRDKVAEDDVERNTTRVTLAKCRGGKTGDAGSWYYDFNTATMHDFDDYWTEERKAQHERQQRGA